MLLPVNGALFIHLQALVSFGPEFSFGRSPSGFWRSESQLKNLRKESACRLGEFLKFPLLVNASEIDEKPALKDYTVEKSCPFFRGYPNFCSK